MNSYFDNSNGTWQAVDVFNPPRLDRGKDFYIDVFRSIEVDGALTGYTFFMAETLPRSLPIVNNKVILLLVAEESYRFAPYFTEIGCILRTYGSFPQFREGAPSSWIKLLSFFSFINKCITSGTSIFSCTLSNRDLLYFRAYHKILHVPLSCFFQFTPKYRPICERAIDYCFLGSVEYHPGRKKFLHNFLTPPKLASRLEMLANMRRFERKSGLKFKLHTTGDFEISIKNQDEYVKTLEDTKISVCPRGGIYETYRFFESLKAGCVVVCEHLPDAWFYENHPALKIQKWSMLPTVLARLIEDPEHMQMLSEKAIEYSKSVLSETAIAARIVEFVQNKKHDQNVKSAVEYKQTTETSTLERNKQ